MKLKPGTIIKITDKEELAALHSISNNVQNAEIAFKLASAQYVTALSSLWNVIHEFYPDTKGFEATYVRKTHEIIIQNKGDE